MAKNCKKESCKAHPTTDGFCFAHSSNLAKTRSLAQSRGGKVGKNPKDRILADLPPILLVHSRDVAVLIAETINHVRAGVMDTKVANCVGILSNCLLKALEQSDIEERLTSVEKIVLERRTMT